MGGSIVDSGMRSLRCVVDAVVLQ